MINKKSVSRFASKYKYIILGILIVSLFLSLIPIPLHIDKRVQAVEITMNDPKIIDVVDVEISGTLYLKIFGENTFDGTFQFYKSNLSNHYPLMKFIKISDRCFAIGYDLNSKNIFQHWGLIIFDTGLKSFVVEILKPNDQHGGSWSPDDGHCFIGPATADTTYEDAIKIYDGIAKSSSFKARTVEM